MILEKYYNKEVFVEAVHQYFGEQQHIFEMVDRKVWMRHTKTINSLFIKSLEFKDNFLKKYISKNYTSDADLTEALILICSDESDEQLQGAEKLKNTLHEICLNYIQNRIFDRVFSNVTGNKEIDTILKKTLSDVSNYNDIDDDEILEDLVADSILNSVADASEYIRDNKLNEGIGDKISNTFNNIKQNAGELLSNFSNDRKKNILIKAIVVTLSPINLKTQNAIKFYLNNTNMEKIKSMKSTGVSATTGLIVTALLHVYTDELDVAAKKGKFDDIILGYLKLIQNQINNNTSANRLKKQTFNSLARYIIQKLDNLKNDDSALGRYLQKAALMGQQGKKK